MQLKKKRGNSHDLYFIFHIWLDLNNAGPHGSKVSSASSRGSNCFNSLSLLGFVLPVDTLGCTASVTQKKKKNHFQNAQQEFDVWDIMGSKRGKEREIQSEYDGGSLTRFFSFLHPHEYCSSGRSSRGKARSSVAGFPASFSFLR